MRWTGILGRMTAILTVIDTPVPGETWTQAIVRRMRGEFAQRGLTMSKVAKMAGMSQSQFSRRMTGALPFVTTEIEHLCKVVGMDRDYILTGARSLPTGGGNLLVGGDETPGSLRLPRLDSNQQPFGEMPRVSLPAAAGL